MIDQETIAGEDMAPAGIASGISLIPGVPLVPGIAPDPDEAAAAPAAHHEIAVRGEPALEPVAGRVIVPPARQAADAPALLRAVLEETGLLFTDYVVFPCRSAVIAVVLWVAYAAARDGEGNWLWRAFPRLLLTSRLNGSGKSTVGDFIIWLLGTRAGRMSKVTPYGLTKVLGKYREAAIADDAHNVFRSDKAGTDLLTVLINGYKKMATWYTGKNDGEAEQAWGPAVIIGKDDLMTKRREYLKDLLDRSVVIRMERPDRYMPEPDEDAEERAVKLGKVLTAVTGALGPQLRQAVRDLARENAGREITEGDGGRTAEIWRPLLAVARVADSDLPPEQRRWTAAAEQAAAELGAASGDLLAAEDALADLPGLPGGVGAGRSFWDDGLAARPDAPAA